MKLSNEGLTFETSAFPIFHGDNSTFINLFDKNQIFMFHSIAVIARVMCICVSHHDMILSLVLESAQRQF